MNDEIQDASSIINDPTWNWKFKFTLPKANLASSQKWAMYSSIQRSNRKEHFAWECDPEMSIIGCLWQRQSSLSTLHFPLFHLLCCWNNSKAMYSTFWLPYWTSFGSLREAGFIFFGACLSSKMLSNMYHTILEIIASINVNFNCRKPQ